MCAQRLISVIIPTYNRAAVCRRAVESVLAQSHSHVEILVIDDGSTDETRQLLSGLDRRVRVVSQVNAGVSAARNTGLQLARGEFIALLDSDDRWLPWKLEAQIAVLDRWPSAGMVCTNMAAVSPAGALVDGAYLTTMYQAYRYFDWFSQASDCTRLGRIWARCPEHLAPVLCYFADIGPWMFMGNLVHTSTVLLRRERADAVGRFDVGLQKSGEDYDFHLRTCAAGAVAFLDASLVEYRVGAPDQLTASEYMVWVARNNLATVTRRYQETHGQPGLPRPLVKRRLADSYNWVGLTEFNRHRAAARAALVRSLAIRPWQPRTCAYLLASLLPPSTIAALRGGKHRLRRLWKRPGARLPS